MEEQDYNQAGEDEQDLTCGNPQCGCVQHKNSLSPIEMNLAHGILPILRATAQKEKEQKGREQNEKGYSQDN